MCLGQKELLKIQIFKFSNSNFQIFKFKFSEFGAIIFVASL